MAKLLVCIALLCVALVSSKGGPGGHGGPGGPGGPGGHGDSGEHGGSGRGNNTQWIQNACNNASAVSTVIIQLQQLITAFQGNSSFNQALQERSNEVAYLQNSTNTALLSSNCTQYLTGLIAAEALDQGANDVERQYEGIVDRAVRQIFGSVFGNNRY